MKIPALAVSLFLANFAAAASPAPPCDKPYDKSYERTFDLTQKAWERLCAGSSDKAGTPPKKDGSPDEGSQVQGLSALDAQRALDSRDFNGLYDRYAGGSADGAAPVVAPPASRPNLTARPDTVGKPSFKPSKAVDANDPPLDPKQVEEHFKSEVPDSFLSRLPGPLGWLGGLVDRGIVKPIRGAFFSGPEKAYVRSMTDKLQESQEGRKIMRGIIAEGIVVHIQPTAFPGSPIVKTGDMEEIHGTRGMAIPDQKQYYFNENFMKMADKDTGLESSASNMGHELNHILLHERIAKRFKKEGYEEVLNFALVDEQSARLKGYVVAYELNHGKPNGYIQEARQLLRKPDDYWKSMKLWMSAYARALDLEEMKDPVRSYQARLEALTDKSDELEREGPGLDFELSRVDHMGSAHGYKDALTQLRSLFQTDKNTLPTRTNDVKESIAMVKERIAYLQSAKGKPFAEKIKNAAKDPRFVALFNEMQGDLTKLEGYRDSKPVAAPKATAGQMGWAAFEKRWDQLHVEAEGQDPPWKEKNGAK